MINVIDGINTVTEFKRHAAEKIGKIKATGLPLVLTVNGKAEVVVQSALLYQQTQDELARLETEAVRAALESLKAGRTRPMTQAIADLRRKCDLQG